MQNKLKELTDKLYQQGLSKGKEEGEQILADAKARASKIVAEAEAEAAKIKAKAEKDAAGLKEKAASDVRTASEQALQATRSDIETALAGAICTQAVKGALSSAVIMKEVILEVAKNFNAAEPQELSVILPENLRKDIEKWCGNELASLIGGKVEVAFSKKIAGGMTIGPKDGSYFVSLTDETFNALISEYLRPVTKKLLFGE